jgi:hypothetical protein
VEPMTGNVVIFEVDAFLYAVISTEEKHVTFVELFDVFLTVPHSINLFNYQLDAQFLYSVIYIYIYIYIYITLNTSTCFEQ